MVAFFKKINKLKATMAFKKKLLYIIMRLIIEANMEAS